MPFYSGVNSSCLQLISRSKSLLKEIFQYISPLFFNPPNLICFKLIVGERKHFITEVSSELQRHRSDCNVRMHLVNKQRDSSTQSFFWGGGAGRSLSQTLNDSIAEDERSCLVNFDASRVKLEHLLVQLICSPLGIRQPINRQALHTMFVSRQGNSAVSQTYWDRSLDDSPSHLGKKKRKKELSFLFSAARPLIL